MRILLGSTFLCGSAELDGDVRNSTGVPMGPQNVRVQENPGAVLREYVGADRVEGERVRCDSGTVSFGTTRIFGTEAEATAWAMTGHRAEAVEGALVVDGETVYRKAVVTSKQVSQVGVAVATQYTIQG